MTQRDAIYSQPKASIQDFCFDQSVAEVFPDMIQRSIPGYSTIIDNIGLIANQYAQAGSNVYDLGCSLGAATLSMRRHVSAKDSQIIAIDIAQPMVEKCQRHIDAFISDVPVTVLCQDILDAQLENASVVVMNFTLQFIEPNRRQAIIDRIFAALRPGGVLILSEKFKHEEIEGDELLIELHHQFKRNNGYSELEISQKRTALENVMILDSKVEHSHRLATAGFSDIVCWFSCFNFMSLVAVKDDK